MEIPSKDNPLSRSPRYVSFTAVLSSSPRFNQLINSPETLVRQLRYPRKQNHRIRLVARNHPHVPLCLFCLRTITFKREMGIYRPSTQIRIYTSSTSIWAGFAGSYEDIMGQLGIWGCWGGGVGWERKEGDEWLERL
jgi:hypothetical protein